MYTFPSPVCRCILGVHVRTASPDVTAGGALCTAGCGISLLLAVLLEVVGRVEKESPERGEKRRKRRRSRD